MKENEYRTIKKSVWMNEKEDAELKRKAGEASMSEARLIRALVTGYHPPVAPGREFHEDMNEIMKLSRSLDEKLKQITNGIDPGDLKEEIAGLKNLRVALIQKYLTGKREQ